MLYPNSFDSPAIDPGTDLLGVASYAEKLADFIRTINPPFTIGIYGEWGSGKTSFVKLAESFLKDYTLSFPTDGTPASLPSSGRKLKAVAKINDHYHFRIFDHHGQLLLDKGKEIHSLDENLRKEIEVGFNGQEISQEEELIWKIVSTLDSELLKKINLAWNTEPIKFIEFSAWPYKTSDELWRALILKIAEKLYESSHIKPSASNEEEDTNNSGWLMGIAKFLVSDALVLRDVPPTPDPSQEYNELLQKLDSTLAGSISKNSEQRVQVNQEETLLAFVKMVTTALSGFSPIIAGLRGIFGLDTQVDPAKLIQRKKNEISRDRIESMQEFQELFCELFEKKASGKRVCIFVDDLDRCTPDVALDLLEAIKIFLGKVPCIFIVAADQTLIGQGLKLRYKDLIDENEPEQVQAFFSQKGQEYFEKIIQMPIRVPNVTSQQSHSFIVSQYPEWVSATDIIQTTIGTNPRRVKQYCNLIRYKYFVSQVEKEYE